MQAIIASWLIAFFEYCLQVPANRIGHVSRSGPFTAPQLKVLQECISLSVFALFSTLMLRERLRLRDGLAFALIFLGMHMLSRWGASTHTQPQGLWWP